MVRVFDVNKYNTSMSVSIMSFMEVPIYAYKRIINNFINFMMHYSGLLGVFDSGVFRRKVGSEGRCVSHYYRSDGCYGEPNMHCSPRAG